MLSQSPFELDTLLFSEGKSVRGAFGFLDDRIPDLLDELKTFVDVEVAEIEGISRPLEADSDDTRQS